MTMKFLFSLAGILAAAYLLITLAAFLLQGRLLFFPSPLSPETRRALADHAIRFDHDGVELHGWLVRNQEPDGRPFLIYYGGNGEELSWNVPRFTELPIAGVLLVNYRGYGDSQGQPSSSALTADAAFIFDELVRREGLSPDEIVLMGRSLGSGVAVDLAARRPVAGLILVTPFDRLSSIASHHYPFLPVRLLMRHEMDSIGLAPEVAAPSLVILAERDRTVPPQYGRRLHEALAGRAELVTVAGADHNDLDGHREYWRAIEEFLAGVLGRGGT
jgi:pimeloyl-ACP methyl ester carboxylesterase